MKTKITKDDLKKWYLDARTQAPKQKDLLDQMYLQVQIQESSIIDVVLDKEVKPNYIPLTNKENTYHFFNKEGESFWEERLKTMLTKKIIIEDKIKDDAIVLMAHEVLENIPKLFETIDPKELDNFYSYAIRETIIKAKEIQEVFKQENPFKSFIMWYNNKFNDGFDLYQELKDTGVLTYAKKLSKGLTEDEFSKEMSRVTGYLVSIESLLEEIKSKS